MGRHLVAALCLIFMAAAPATGGVVDNTGWLKMGWGAARAEVRDGLGIEVLDDGGHYLKGETTILGMRAILGCYFNDAQRLVGVLVSVVCEEIRDSKEVCTQNEFSLLRLRLLKTLGPPFSFSERMSLWVSQESYIILGLSREGHLGIHYYSRELFKGLKDHNLLTEAQYYDSRVRYEEKKREKGGGKR